MTTTTGVPASFAANAASAATAAAPPTTWTNSLWAGMVLTLLGAPLTSNNVSNMLHWMSAENPSTSWATSNNPLNTTVGVTSGSFGQADLLTGAQHTAQTIQQQNMAPIDAALMQNAPLTTFAAAVVASPWDAGHYGGTPAGITTTSPSIVDSGIATNASTGSGGNATTAGFGSTLWSWTGGQIWRQTQGSLSLGSSAYNGVKSVAGGVAGAATSAADALGSVGTLVSDITQPGMWLRAAEFMLGSALLLTGLVLFVATSKPGTSAKGNGAAPAAAPAAASGGESMAAEAAPLALA